MVTSHGDCDAPLFAPGFHNNAATSTATWRAPRVVFGLLRERTGRPVARADAFSATAARCGRAAARARTRSEISERAARHAGAASVRPTTSTPTTTNCIGSGIDLG